MEWGNKTKYNSFNSYKGLTYYENYISIAEWLQGASENLPPPIECNLDPVRGCNLDCYFCITQGYMKDIKYEKLPLDYMLRLVDFLANWGVRGLCISGGGEPTLHKGLPELIDFATGKMDVAVVTNATKFVKELVACRWVALSVDAANRQTYKAIKGKDVFDKVCANINKLFELREAIKSRVDLCFKFLILPENQYEIYDACKLAKELGVQDFHARPCDFEKQDIVGHKKLTLDIVGIHEQFEKCHELEDENFHVYTITHKFDAEFHVKHDFPACLAAPMILPILTDGNAYLCVEHKMDEKYCIGSCYPDPERILEWWGSDRHRQMINGILPDRDCSRCIYSQYHQQIGAIKTDSMCVNFP